METEVRRLKRPLVDALIGVQFTPFSWGLNYGVFAAGRDVHLGPFHFRLVWPETLKLKYDK